MGRILSTVDRRKFLCATGSAAALSLSGRLGLAQTLPEVGALHRLVEETPHERVAAELAGLIRAGLDHRRTLTALAVATSRRVQPFPDVGFIVTNLSRPAERVVAFYNQRGTAEQWIKEGKNAIKWTRLSCRSLRNNAVRLQLHALAYNLGNFMRTLALPDAVEQWSLTTLREKLVKIGAKVVSHGRYVTFQLAEVAVTRSLFQKILSLIDDLRRRPAPA